MTAALSARREAWRRAVYRFGRSGLSVTGLVLVLLLLFLSIFGPWLAPYPEHITGSISTASRFGPPSAKHWFGTNEMGQDVLSLVLGGTVLVETIFDWPGLGLYATKAVVTQDFMPIIGVTLVIGTLFVAANLVIDLLYGVINPKVRQPSPQR